MTKIIILLFALSFFSSLTFAEDAPTPAAPVPEAAPPAREEPKDLKHFAGFLMGSGRGTGSTDVKGLFIVGVRAGYGVFKDNGGILSVGAILETQKETSTLGSIAVSARSVFTGAEILYREVCGTGLYIGARAGAAYLNIQAATATASIESDNTTFAVGPAAGYEFKVSERVSLGVDVSWLSIQGGSFPVGTLNIPYGNINILMYQGGINFHF